MSFNHLLSNLEIFNEFYDSNYSSVQVNKNTWSVIKKCIPIFCYLMDEQLKAIFLFLDMNISNVLDVYSTGIKKYSHLPPVLNYDKIDDYFINT